jgi:hypothetical protein
VGKLACWAGEVIAMTSRSFAHAIEPHDLIAWANL